MFEQGLSGCSSVLESIQNYLWVNPSGADLAAQVSRTMTGLNVIEQDSPTSPLELLPHPVSTAARPFPVQY